MKYYCIALCVAVVVLLSLNSCAEQDIGCVAEGTLVSTPNGTTLVENLRVGDFVLSPDPMTQQIHRGRIAAIRTARRECLVFTLEGGRQLFATPEHPLWDPVSLSFKPAGEFSARDLVALTSANTNNISSSCIVNVSDQIVMSKVYDLTVESNPRTFLANGVVVHNKQPPATPAPPPVTDLAIELVDDTTVRAIWTEPGDSTETLSVARFFIDTVAVTDSTLNHQRTLIINLLNVTGGTVDTTLLGELEQSTMYFVRMWVFRSGSLPSELSNEVSFTTGP